MTTDLALELATRVLAVGPPGPEQGKASPWGVVITLLLVVAVFVLGWSMQKHLKNLPKSFDEPGDPEPDRDDAARGKPESGSKTGLGSERADDL